MKKRIKYLLLIWIALYGNIYGQTLDKTLAVVGKYAVFKSDIDNQYRYAIINGAKDDGTLKCKLIEELILNYMLLTRADADSIEVSADMVENELNRRLSLMIQQAGSQEEIEKIYGKPILQLKVELRPKVEQQLKIEQIKQKIMGKVEVTPKDVREFFNSLPEDSLPYFPAEVIIAHLVKYPKPSEMAKEMTIKKLLNIRKQIINGKATFEEMAKKYSQDLASGKNGGYLGQFTKGTMVPEFEEVLATLQEGEISHPFESPFGYHIVKLHKRLGNTFEASHILIRAIITKKDEQKVIQELKKIKKLIESDSLTFAQAVKKFSEDRMTKESGGIILSREGSIRIPIDELDAELYLAIDDLKEKQVSDPIPYYMQGMPIKGYRLVYVIKKYPPHKANLEYDYEKFYKTLTQIKKQEKLEEWKQKAKKNIPIYIYDKDCESVLKDKFYIE